MSKSRDYLLAASGAFLERCRDEERAEIIERLCQSAAASALYDYRGDDTVGLNTPIATAIRRERQARIEPFISDYDEFDVDGQALGANVALFPDLYGDWVYQP